MANAAATRCLRPIADQDAQDKVRDLILSAYVEHEAQNALAR